MEQTPIVNGNRNPMFFDGRVEEADGRGPQRRAARVDAAPKRLTVGSKEISVEERAGGRGFLVDEMARLPEEFAEGVVVGSAELFA